MMRMTRSKSWRVSRPCLKTYWHLQSAKFARDKLGYFALSCRDRFQLPSRKKSPVPWRPKSPLQ